MSSQSEATRTRILAAARRLLEERGYHGVGLEEIAVEAGVSRQAVYLHFGSKSGLLVGLVEWVDRAQRLSDGLAQVCSAKSGVEALERAIDQTADYEPQIHRLAMVLAAARRTDPAAEDAWQNRMGERRRIFRRIAEWIQSDRMLAPGWNVGAAADLMWAVTAPSTYDDLVIDHGWSPRRWAQHTKRLLIDALARS